MNYAGTLVAHGKIPKLLGEIMTRHKMNCTKKCFAEYKIYDIIYMIQSKVKISYAIEATWASLKE